MDFIGSKRQAAAACKACRRQAGATFATGGNGWASTPGGPALTGDGAQLLLINLTNATADKLPALAT